jgi:hypothetical protein
MPLARCAGRSTDRRVDGIMTVVVLVLGVKLVGDTIGGLSS